MRLDPAPHTLRGLVGCALVDADNLLQNISAKVVPQSLFDTGLHGLSGSRAGHASPHQTQHHSSPLAVHPDDLDVAAVRHQHRPHGLQHRADVGQGELAGDVRDDSAGARRAPCREGAHHSAIRRLCSCGGYCTRRRVNFREGSLLSNHGAPIITFDRADEVPAALGRRHRLPVEGVVQVHAHGHLHFPLVLLEDLEILSAEGARGGELVVHGHAGGIHAQLRRPLCSFLLHPVSRPHAAPSEELDPHAPRFAGEVLPSDVRGHSP
mmetsp:Transcript_176/g.565  ORF Transcript_176/g.565 Transcript_176/m.565 type:complete len:266 (+) Transcript_176:268-1065(+)